MENWTFRFLFGCDGGDDTSRLKACLHFVQTSTDIQAGITIFSKIDSILGALKKSSTKNKNKKSNKKDRKKKEKEDDDFLGKEQAKVREEKQVLDNAARFGRAMGCNSLVRCLGKIGNKIRYKAGVSALREHSEAVTLIKVVLARMLLEWTNTARLRLGTHSDSTCALAWNIEEDKGWWRKIQWKVRTHSQHRFMRMYFALCLETKRDSLSWTYCLQDWVSTWTVHQYIYSFKIQWVIELVVHTSVDLFFDPSVVPLAISQVMVPSKTNDICKYFCIDSQDETVMNKCESVHLMHELLECLADRKLTTQELKDFDMVVTSFWSNECNGGDIRFVWCCSSDGIFLMSGVSKDKGSDRKKVHPFASITGFGGFPDWLPVSKVDARKMTFFCKNAPQSLTVAR